ncbi:MAG: hypothetical protein Q8L21_00735 [Candidatus Komeilibacteria bacterium]|nr:hypothetical protein [Candidatus Komeilibacteria bacterium]
MIKKFLKQIKTSEQGSLLLMSMLILSGIVTAAGTMGIVTLQNLRQSIAVDQGLVSFYAAESGVEDGLYELRKKETIAATLPLGGVLTNTASWSRSIVTTADTLTKDIDKNDFWEINIYNPDDSLSPLSNPIKSVQITWTGDGAEWIEAEVDSWTTAGDLIEPTKTLFSHASNPGIVNFQDAATIMYRLRLKALYGDAADMTVTAYSGLNAGGSVVPLPAQITLFSTGSFLRTKQALRATMPQRSPLGGVFDYVLFSEDDLTKQ